MHCIRTHEIKEEMLRSRMCAYKRANPSEEVIIEEISSGSYLDKDDVHSTQPSVQRVLNNLDLNELLEQELSGVEDGWDDSFAMECDGVWDVIITGKTLMQHGQAWHHY
ncbi:hypothetical protein A0H81_06468 [Grifola frondosa]|uniref:Uncharacterized protein n=1 Tax=Grifola frondosa TaxID=5627 RepID=A0A1C7MBF7_GRIFR|nr:hypothetical protein A0H81_06468 [Grifola frondosa]